VKIKRIFTHFTAAALISATFAVPPSANAYTFTDSETGIGINAVSTVLKVDEFAFDGDLSDFDIFTFLALDVMGKRPKTRLWRLSDGYFPMTAFVPTDRAFKKLVKSMTGVRYTRERRIYEVARTLGTDKLNQVLLYHLVFGDPLLAEDVLAANDTLLTTPREQTFRVVYDGTELKLRDKDRNRINPRVILSRVNNNEGNYQVIHPINGVLIPNLS
jgi:uncharacterized surface protein with fasciclin (FAS1) repeats